MPVRGEVKEAPRKEAVAKEVKETAPRKAPAKQEPAKEVKQEVIKRSILEEKVKKFISTVAKDLLDNVNDVFERSISDPETGEKANVLFLAFSPGGTEDDVVDDEFNKECIKTLLFHYHTAPDKAISGKMLFVEVMPPTEPDAPHILCFQEI